MGLQYSITAIGSVILQSAVNSLGSHAVAAMTAGSKIGMFFCCPFDALGSTMATYGGQNVGAKKLDRVSGGLKAASILGCAYAVLAFVIMFFLPWGAGRLLCRGGRAGSRFQCRTVFADQQCILYPIGICQHRAFPDPGNGLQQICYFWRVCLRWLQEHWSDLRLCLFSATWQRALQARWHGSLRMHFYSRHISMS